MIRRLTRRSLVNSALAGTVSLGLTALMPKTVFGTTASSPITVQRLSDQVIVLTGAGGNALAMPADDGLLLVDGGARERSADLLRTLATQFPGRKVTTLLNTHWHWDHTGSNETLARAGATIVAHENTKLWLDTEITSQWEGRTYARRPAPALPRRTFFYDAQRLEVGTGAIEYGLLPQAHTDGDIYVHVAAHNVLVGGDVVSGGAYPIVDYSTGGWIGGMIAGLRLLIGKCASDTRVVPGSGPMRTRADLEAQLEMCRTVASRIAASYLQGQTWEEFVASNPTREFDRVWGDPSVFLRTAHAGAWWHINELRRATF